MKTLTINNEQHEIKRGKFFPANRKAARAAYFMNIRSDKRACFGTYCLPVTFADLATENLLSNNQN